MAGAPPVKYRMDGLKSGVLITAECVVWLAQALLALTVVLEPIAVILGILMAVFVPLTFFLMGVNPFTGKKTTEKIIALASGLVISIVPFVNEIPGFLMGTIRIILISREEDREKAAQEAKAVAEVETRAARRRQDLWVENQQAIQAANDAEAAAEAA